MTTYFVSNAGSNTSPYDTEAKAATSLGTVIAIPVTKTDVVKVSSTHSENSGGAITYTLPTDAPGLEVISVTFNGSGSGAAASGAAVNTNGNFALAFNGYGYFSGINFSTGAGGNSSGANINICNTGQSHWQQFDNCSFFINSTSGTPKITIGPSAAGGDKDTGGLFRDCSVRFGATGQAISMRFGFYDFEGFSINASGSAPTSLFILTTSTITILNVKGSDLSGKTWTNLVDVSSGFGAPSRVSFAQCDLPSGFTNLVTGTLSSPGGAEVTIVDCDSGDVHYTFFKTTYAGTITAQNSIYADSGDGSNNIGWTAVASAGASFINPLILPPIEIRNNTLSAMTTTVEVASNNVTFKDNELWQETLAKVTSGSTKGTWERSDRAASPLSSGSNQDTSTKTWTGVPGTPVTQKLVSGSFTPDEVGNIVVQVYLAKANATAYISPKVA